MDTPLPVPGSSVLITRTSRCACALPLGHVSEVMRPLPIEPVDGAPPGVRGLAVIRGRVTPVVDLEALFGDGASTRGDRARFVTIRVGDRRVALVVESVRGIQTLAGHELDALPPLWRGPHPPAVAALGALDRQLLLVLESARLVSADESAGGGGHAP
ncbi:MAG TPA: chemotaxis protein CheW [Opitutaceae bacterium]|nr:chemotaxis protein CheW [Opitutaceae bacterium]